MGIVAKLGLGPLLLAQALYVRRRAVRLPEPSGARTGVTGHGTPLRLLLIGDSAAAGVGVAQQDDALLGQLVRQLASSHCVTWRLHARTGATTGDTLHALGEISGLPFDVVVTSLGVNDVTTGLSQAQFIARQQRLIDRLKADCGARLIVLSGLPPVRRFPLLPQPLRWYLGREAERFDRALEAAVAADPVCAYFRQPSDGGIEMMASDGFHPGAPVYARWAALVAAIIGARMPAPERATPS